MVGADASGLRESLSVAMEMKQVLYRRIVDGVKKGMTFDQAFEDGQKEVLARKAAFTDEVFKAWADQAIADMKNFRRENGSERSLAIAQKLLMDKKFEIRKGH
jgi:hypothetical protein